MITKNFYNFLAKLESNNNKAWFDVHRSEYETEVKKPFEEFVMALGDELHRFDHEIAGDFKKNIFRINRDIRFAKDKTPYKTHRSAAYSLHGKKDHNDPGYYIELGINQCGIAGGAWAPSPEKLQKIRSEIYYNSDEFHQIVEHKSFKKLLGGVQGEQSKKLPKDIAAWGDESPYIYYKQFYFWTKFDLEDSLQKDFIQKIGAQFRAGYAFNQFLRRAMRDS